MDISTTDSSKIAIWEDNGTSEITMIPILSQKELDNVDHQIAQAPLAPVAPVATLQQLTSELVGVPVFLALADIDLRLLTKRLQKPSSLAEEDVRWTKDGLMSALKGEIHGTNDCSM